MRGGFYAKRAALGLLPLVAGCVQATRHSNTMIFGTNTSFGLKVGTSAAQVPAISVGYDRQEAVIMPLVANTKDGGGLNRLGPCDIQSPVVPAAGGTGSPVHPCLLVAVNGKAMESYSVLASFGADFSADTNGAPSASGGLAQYFATGVAAQLLALNGGAAVVATGEAAKSAGDATATKQTIEALYGKDASFVAGVAVADAYTAFRTDLLAKIQLTDPAKLSGKVAALETATQPASPIAARCSARQPCQAAVLADVYLLDFQNKADAFNAALKAWVVE